MRLLGIHPEPRAVVSPQADAFQMAMACQRRSSHPGLCRRAPGAARALSSSPLASALTFTTAVSPASAAQRPLLLRGSFPPRASLTRLPATCAMTAQPHKRPSRAHQRKRTVPSAAAAPPAAVAATATASASGATTATTTAGTAAAATAAASSSWMDVFAVLLGYACLVGSFFRSVPQIAVILRTGSAEGLSLTSNLVELLCFTVTVAYNIQQGYPFNTYGEVFACWIQDAIIVGLIFRHMRLGGHVVAAATAAFAVYCAWLFSPLCPMQVLSGLQVSTVVIMVVGARVPQIWLNMRRGNAGVLSPLTCLLNVAGCLVRVFTTLVLTHDVIILGGCVTQLILNGILLYQSVFTPGNRVPTTATAAMPAAAAAAAVEATDPPAGGGMGGEARGKPAAVGGDVGTGPPGVGGASPETSSSRKSPEGDGGGGPGSLVPAPA